MVDGPEILRKRLPLADSCSKLLVKMLLMTVADPSVILVGSPDVLNMC